MANSIVQTQAAIGGPETRTFLLTLHEDEYVSMSSGLLQSAMAGKRSPASSTFAAYHVHTLWPKQQTVVAAPLKASPHHSHSQQPFVKIAYLHMTLTQARPSPLCRILYKTQLTGNTAGCIAHHCRILCCLENNYNRKSSQPRICTTCMSKGDLCQDHLLQITQGHHEHTSAKRLALKNTTPNTKHHD